MQIVICYGENYDESVNLRVSLSIFRQTRKDSPPYRDVTGHVRCEVLPQYFRRKLWQVKKKIYTLR